MYLSEYLKQNYRKELIKVINSYNTGQKVKITEQDISKILCRFCASYYCAFEKKNLPEDTFAVNNETGAACFDIGMTDINKKRLFLCFERNDFFGKQNIIGIKEAGNEWFRDKMLHLPMAIDDSYLLDRKTLTTTKNYKTLHIEYAGYWVEENSEGVDPFREHIIERLNDGERFPKFIRNLGEDVIMKCIDEAREKADELFDEGKDFFEVAFHGSAINNNRYGVLCYFIPVKFRLDGGKTYTMALVGDEINKLNKHLTEKLGKKYIEKYINFQTIYKLDDAIDKITAFHKITLPDFSEKQVIENGEIEGEYNKNLVERIKKNTDGGMEM